MASEGTEEEEALISRGLYRLVSDVVGPEVKIKLRRERWKTQDFIRNSQGRREIRVMSGSIAEGFYMKTSDLDFMFWSKDVIVVENYDQFMNYHPHYKTVLMIDCDCTSPGFALVMCITRADSEQSVASACVKQYNEFWISSKLYMEYYSKLLKGTSPHGPCQSGEMLGKEYDFARCLKCAFWPTQASSSIFRMRRCGWPPEDVIQEIVRDGCLLVPVASKRPYFKDASDLEWRISFSLAEKRLLHSMNHCQFLCYGLWKIFLSEVVKKLDGVEDLLCSYFLKTVLFWEICRDGSLWTPSNLISTFLRTLEMLIHFVNSGYCPNFFIPDNNMFFGKIYGNKQTALMSYLRTFQNEGFLCLLRCHSLQNVFLPFIMNPLLARTIEIDEMEYISNSQLRMLYLDNICQCDRGVGNIRESLHELANIQTVNNFSDFMSTALAIRTRRLLQNIAERNMHEMIRFNSVWTPNKNQYSNLKLALNILRDINTYLGHSELIMAKAFYISGNYSRAIHFANIVRAKLQNNDVTYDWRINEDINNAPDTNETTIVNFIEQHVATFFVLDEDTPLYELYPEIQARGETTGSTLLFIPPLVLANFLLFLSHHKMNDMIQMYDVLRELHALVHHDDNIHIDHDDKTISWEILGICQQLCGEYPTAFNSYINALQDEYNDFKPATVDRIASLQSQVDRNW